jgi:hypothetical protein
VNVYAFRNNGIRVPPWPKQVGDTTVALETCPAISDLEDDGKMEVIVATVTRGLVVWEIQPTGTGTAKAWWPMEGQNISRTNYIAPTRSPNRSPLPPTLNGPTAGVAGQAFAFSAVATDPDGDNMKYTFDWGDATTTTTALTGSGITVSANHTWQNEGTYSVRVQAADQYGKASPWSNPLSIVVAKPAIEVVTTTTANTYSFFGYVSSYNQTAQSFKAVESRISAISVALAKGGKPNMDIVCHIRETLWGPDLGSGVIPYSSITSTNYSSPTWVRVGFPNGVNVVKGKTYFVVLTVSKTNAMNYYLVPLNKNNPYPDGQWYKGSVGSRQPSYDMLAKLTFGETRINNPM